MPDNKPRAIRLESDGFGMSTKVVDVVTGEQLPNVVAVDVAIRPEDLVRATITTDLFHLKVTVPNPEWRNRTWDAFVQHERKAAEAGSGFTHEQMTGANLFWLWLERHVKDEWAREKVAQDRYRSEREQQRMKVNPTIDLTPKPE